MNANGSLNGFTLEQRKWMIARLLSTSDAAAARAVGLHPSTVCKWPNKALLDEAIEQLLEDPKGQAVTIMLDAVPEAARVKVGGLRSRRERIRQVAAGEILDRMLGKPTQKQEISGPDGGPVVIVSWDDANGSA